MAPRREERSVAFNTLAAILIPAFRAMSQIRVRNPGALPQHGAFVLSPNHSSEIDPIVMAIAVWNSGRAPRFMAKSSLWKIPVVRWALESTQQIPVERSGASRTTDPMVAARKIVDEQSAVIIYPEGSLTRDPELWPMRGKSGAVRMALQAGIPLIPAAHWGTQALMPRYGKRIRPFPRKKIDVLFGEPMDMSVYGGRTDSATVTRATDDLMAAIAALLGELRGEQPPAERWDPVKNQQTETGRFDG